MPRTCLASTCVITSMTICPLAPVCSTEDIEGKRLSKRTSTTLPRTAVTLPRFGGLTSSVMRGLELRPRLDRFCVFYVAGPLPMTNFRHVFAVLIDVQLVLDELVLDDLLQVRAFRAYLRQPIEHVLHQMKSIDVILHPHVERGGNRALFLIATHVQISIRSTIGEPVHELRITVEPENDVFIGGEERIVVR